MELFKYLMIAALGFCIVTGGLIIHDRIVKTEEVYGPVQCPVEDCRIKVNPRKVSLSTGWGKVSHDSRKNEITIESQGRTIIIDKNYVNLEYGDMMISSAEGLLVYRKDDYFAVLNPDKETMLLFGTDSDFDDVKKAYYIDPKHGPMPVASAYIDDYLKDVVLPFATPELLQD